MFIGALGSLRSVLASQVLLFYLDHLLIIPIPIMDTTDTLTMATTPILTGITAILLFMALMDIGCGSQVTAVILEGEKSGFQGIGHIDPSGWKGNSQP